VEAQPKLLNPIIDKLRVDQLMMNHLDDIGKCGTIPKWVAIVHSAAAVL
jgi:hypothetical protein